MALYDVVTASGRTITVDAPPGTDDATVKQLALSQMLGPAPAPPEPETSFGGYAKEFFKGIPAGAVSALESGATGITQLLPDAQEAAARQTVADYGKKFRAPFEPNPGYEDSIAAKLGQGVGSTAIFPLSLLAGPVAGPALAAGMAASMGAGEATQRAAASGASEEEISSAGALGVLPGLMDVLPAAAMLKRANVLRKAIGPAADQLGKGVLEQAAKITATRTGRVTQAALEEGVQEVAQEVAQNMIARGVYDPEQGVFQGTGESLGYGAGVGGLIQALVELAIPGRARTASSEPPQPESTEDAPTAALDESMAPPPEWVQPQAPGVDTTDDFSEAADVRDTAALERMYQEDSDRAVLEEAELEDQMAAAAREEEAKQAQEAAALDDAEQTAEIERLYQQDRERDELQRIAQVQQLDVQREQARQQQTTAKRRAVLQPLIEAEDVGDVRQAFLAGLQQAGFGAKQLVITPEEEQLIQRADDVKAAVASAPAAVEEPTPVVPSSPNEMDVEAVVPEKKAKPPVQPSLPGVPQPTTPKPQEGVLNLLPAELDALGIPSAAPLRKRVAKKDLNDPAQRQQVAQELGAFAALPTTTPQVREKIETMLQSPDWRGQPATAPQPQGEMFGPRGGVRSNPFDAPPPAPPTTSLESGDTLTSGESSGTAVQPAGEVDTKGLKRILKSAKAVPVAETKPVSAEPVAEIKPAPAPTEQKPETPAVETQPAPAPKAEPAVQEEKPKPRKAKPTPKKTQDEEDVAVAETESKQQDKDVAADREKIAALDDAHPAKKYFKEGEALQVSLSALATDTVHKKDAKTKEASEWVRKNLSDNSRKAYERRLAEAVKDGRLLFNAADPNAYELATPLPKQVQDLLDNNGEVSATTLLNSLLPSLNKRAKRAAKALLAVVPSVKVVLKPGLKDARRGVEVAGAYDSKTKTVYLNSQYGATIHTLMHELAHAATSHVLNNPSHPAAKQLNKLYEDVKNWTPDEKYGLKDVKEFVAEAFSNPEFQALLASMRASNTDPNFLRRLANAVRQLLGLPRVDYTLDTQVSDLIYELLSPAPDGMDYGMMYNAAQGGAAEKKALFDKLYQKLPGERKDDLEVVSDWLSDAGRKVASTALQVLPLNAVADLIKKDIPSAQTLFKLLNEVHGTRANTNRQVRQTGIDLREKLGTDQQVHKLFNDIVAESTLNQVDPTEPRTKYSEQEQLDAWDKLQKDWKRLGALRPQAQQAYKDLRNAYRKAYNDMVGSIDERVSQMDMTDNAKASMKKQLRQFIKRNSVEPYFPLYRHGEYWLAFRHKSSMESEVMAFDSVADRTRAVQALRGDPELVDVQEFANPGEFNNYQARVPGTFTYKLMQNLADLEKSAVEELEKSLTARGATAQERTDALAAAQADHEDLREKTLKMILDAMPESAFAQQFRKREGTLGFERDALKVYDKRMASLMNQVTNMKYASTFAKLDERIRAEARDKGDQPKHAGYVKLLRQYMDFARNPTLPTWSRAAKSLTFGMTLGFGVAPVLVNMTNLPIVTMPWLGAKYGTVETAKALAEAVKVYSGTGFTRSEDLLVPTVDAQGNVTTKRTAAFSGLSLDNLDYTAESMDARTKRLAPLVQLMRERGEMVKSHAAEALDLNNSTSTVWDKMNATMGALFHHGERFNRQVTAIAAYNLELDALKAAGKPIDEAAMRAAAEKAIDAVEWTNSGADLATAPRVAQSGLGSLLFMYKRFGVSMMYNQFKMAREMLRGADEETRRVAKRQIAGLYASSALLAGVQGVPLYGAMAMIWDMLFTDEDDEDFNTLSVKFFGEGMYSGVLNYLTGSDWASRIGMTNLIMRSQPNVEQESWVMSMMESLGGPVLGQMSRLEDGVGLINDGEVYRGLERMLPSVGANLMKSARYLTEGATTLRGDPITEDVGPGNVFMQALGFAPTTYIRQLQQNAVNKRVDRETTARITKLLRLRYMAIRQGDADELAEVDAEIMEMNEKHPGLIPPDTMLRSLKQHMRTTEQMKKYGGVMISPRMQPIVDAMNVGWED